MNDTSTPVHSSGSAAAPKSGLLKWGLLGCGVLSAVLIVGLVVVATKARSMMGWALSKMEEQTLASCTPDVTAEQRAAFHAAYADFAARAEKGKVPVDAMSAFRGKLMSAVSDGKVTPQELSDLTVAVSERPAPK